MSTERTQEERKGWAWLSTTVVIPILAIVTPLVFTLLGFIIMHLHEECMTGLRDAKDTSNKIELRVLTVEQSNESNKQRIGVVEAQNSYIKQLLEEVRKDVGFIKDNMKRP